MNAADHIDSQNSPQPVLADLEQAVREHMWHTAAASVAKVAVLRQRRSCQGSRLLGILGDWCLACKMVLDPGEER